MIDKISPANDNAIQNLDSIFEGQGYPLLPPVRKTKSVERMTTEEWMDMVRRSF